MDRDANYVAVGAFVLLVIAMAVSFVFWYTDQQDRRTYQRYEIYFPGSVSGLTAGSPVRYLGVDVGRVVRIGLDPQQRKTVQVIVDIDSTAPIDDRTRASLSLQGVTGLLFIDLEQDPKAESTGVLAQGQHYPMIRSRRSDFDVLLSNLPALTTHLVELANHFNEIFSDENVRGLKSTLENVRLASERLPETVREAQQLLVEVRRTTQEVQGTVAQLHGLIAAGFAGPRGGVRQYPPDFRQPRENHHALEQLCGRERTGLFALLQTKSAGIRAAAARESPGGPGFPGPVAEPEAESLTADLRIQLPRNRGAQVKRTMLLALLGMSLAACAGSLFKNKAAPPTMYLLGATPSTAAVDPSGSTVPSDLAVLRPRVRAGLDTDRIAALYPDRHMDYFADVRWSGPLDEVLQDLAVQQFHASPGLGNVSPEASVFGSPYWLEIEVIDFQAEYSAAGSPPTVHVHLQARIGSSGDRHVLGRFEPDVHEAAADNRMSAIVDAYNRAADTALAQIAAGVARTLEVKRPVK